MPTWKSLFSGNSERGRIITSVLDNLAGNTNVLSLIYQTSCGCTGLNFAQTTTDVKLEQQIQMGVSVKFKGFLGCIFLYNI